MFKVGQNVKVRTGLVGGRRYCDSNGESLYFSYGMEKYCGDKYVIEYIEPYGMSKIYRLKGIHSFVFSEAMLDKPNDLRIKLEERELL